MDEDPELTLECGGQYSYAEIMLPRRDKMARVQVVNQKHNNNGNQVGRSNRNFILGMHLEVKFSGATELAANIIAELMYTQCDFKGNEYLLLEVFLEHKKVDFAFREKNQKVVVKGRETLASGKMAPHCGRSYPILRSCTQLRLTNML